MSYQWRFAQLVDVPHDSMINGTYAERYDNHHGSLPRNVSWYRKHFRLPSEWQEQGSTYLHFDAIFHLVTVWINDVYLGAFHSGYIPIRIPLHNQSAIHYGDTENVIAIRADASFGSGTPLHVA
jgi:sacsin